MLNNMWVRGIICVTARLEFVCADSYEQYEVCVNTNMGGGWV